MKLIQSHQIQKNWTRYSQGFIKWIAGYLHLSSTDFKYWFTLILFMNNIKILVYVTPKLTQYPQSYINLYNICV